MYRDDDGELRATKEDDIVLTFLASGVLDFLNDVFGPVQRKKRLTPPLECPECGESFEEAEEEHRLQYRNRHRDQHGRWISATAFIQNHEG